MSIPALNYVFKARIGNATRKLVLIARADNANADGTASWMAVKNVAVFAECDERTVQRHTASLIHDGYLREGDQRHVAHLDPRNRPIVYDVALNEETRTEWAALAADAEGRRTRAAEAGMRGGKASAEARRLRGDNVTPLDQEPGNPQVSGGDNVTPQSGGDTGVTPGVTKNPSRGDTGVTQTVLEPSLEPPEPEDSLRSSSAAAALTGDGSAATGVTSSGRKKSSKVDELNRLAEATLRPWWSERQGVLDRAAGREIPAKWRLPSTKYVVIKNLITSALAAGRPPDLVIEALTRLVAEARGVSGPSLDIAMGDIAAHPEAPAGWRQWAPAERQQRAGRGAPRVENRHDNDEVKARLLAQRRAATTTGGVR
jgi:hypothetical protein